MFYQGAVIFHHALGLIFHSANKSTGYSLVIKPCEKQTLQSLQSQLNWNFSREDEVVVPVCAFGLVGTGVC